MVLRNLRSIREDRDIKQREIAEVLHVSQNTYSQYETGKIELTARVLVALADYYHCSTDYLLDRTNNPDFPACSSFPPASEAQGGAEKG